MYRPFLTDCVWSQRNDAEAPAWMHQKQVFVTVKHSKASVSESVIPQFEVIEGREATFQTRPKEGQLSPQRSGAMWQQGYLSSVTGQGVPRCGVCHCFVATLSSAFALIHYAGVFRQSGDSPRSLEGPAAVGRSLARRGL